MVALRYANRVFKTPHFDYPRAQIVQIIQWYYRGKTKSLRSIVTGFNFGAVQLPLNLPNILVTPTKSGSRSPLLSKSLLKLTEPFWISHVPCAFLFFFGLGHLLKKVSWRVDFMTGVLSNCFLFTLLYETAVVETPQSALWPTQNTTERFVAYSKHHKALCGLFKTP